MASTVSRLRLWFAFGAILMIATVGGMYFYAQWSLRKAVHALPAKLGLDIQQTAEGFSISKSTEGHTQFTVSASKAVQFKAGGRAELHNVKIIIYGKDSGRFDQIAGDDFEYDPASGNISAKGKVLIDLEANPEGIRHLDQVAPVETRDPIHLETNGLVFNKNTGDASATGKVVFQTPQAYGSAVGIEYVAKTGTMSLRSAVALTVSRPQAIELNADRGVITKQPRQVVLNTVHMRREQQEIRSQQATFFLRGDNTVDHILAEGDVESEVHGRTASKPKTTSSTTASSDMRERSDQAELFLTGTRNLLTKAILSGNVKLSTEGAQPAEATAGRATLDFKSTAAGQQLLKTVHAEGGVRLTQSGQSGSMVAMASPPASSVPSSTAPSSALASPKGGGSQDIEMTAPAMDFVVKDGRLLELAETSGPPRIVITQPEANQKTVVTAVKFTAKFTEKNRLATLHGEPEAKIVSSLIDPNRSNVRANAIDASKTGPGSQSQNERVSTSKTLDVVFLPEGGVRSLTQTGGVAYDDGSLKAWAERGEYTTADQVVVLTGSPRVVDGGMTTTALTMRMSRVTGDAIAEGNVKSTYSDLKAQPDGGMLASSDPIHVTSRTMTAHRSPSIAVYTGNARLWQNANVVEAPTLQFDRDHRSVLAQGEASGGAGRSPATTRATTLAQPVSTVLVQVDKTGKVTPIHVTSARLRYSDAERQVFLDGGVTAKTADLTMTAEQMTVFLLPQSQSKAKANPGTNSATPGQVDKIIAEGKVVITQPTRHATGDRLVYTSADDKFVLTGGPPSIFDAERGKTTGDSLTFYRHDDRVLVEGRATSPVVTRTEVAR